MATTVQFARIDVVHWTVAWFSQQPPAWSRWSSDRSKCKSQEKRRPVFYIVGCQWRLVVSVCAARTGLTERATDRGRGEQCQGGDLLLCLNLQQHQQQQHGWSLRWNRGVCWMMSSHSKRHHPCIISRMVLTSVSNQYCYVYFHIAIYVFFLSGKN